MTSLRGRPCRFPGPATRYAWVAWHLLAPPRRSVLAWQGGHMRIVLADLKGGEGFTSKDTVAGGYGSRLRPFSRVTSVVAKVKREFHDLPSVHLAYVAAIAARAGHEVVATAGDLVD